MCVIKTRSSCLDAMECALINIVCVEQMPLTRNGFSYAYFVVVNAKPHFKSNILLLRPITSTPVRHCRQLSDNALNGFFSNTNYVEQQS